jgi:glutamate-1-semialdehyde 2,1-aminomutase
VGAFGGRAEIMDLVAPLGPVYQAGTLSGNPLALAAGIAALDLLEETKPYERLDALGRRVQGALAGACRAKGLPSQVPQTGSMFSIFFTPQAVHDYAGALTGDAALFARFFRGCLEAGVYLPPSAYETAFISTAHEGAAIDRACDVMASVIRGL